MHVGICWLAGDDYLHVRLLSTGHKLSWAFKGQYTFLVLLYDSRDSKLNPRRRKGGRMFSFFFSRVLKWLFCFSSLQLRRNTVQGQSRWGLRTALSIDQQSVAFGCLGHVRRKRERNRETEKPPQSAWSMFKNDVDIYDSLHFQHVLPEDISDIWHNKRIYV